MIVVAEDLEMMMLIVTQMAKKQSSRILITVSSDEKVDVGNLG